MESPKRLGGFRPKRAWEKLSKSIRERLTALGFDSYSWNNQLKEVVPVLDSDLFHNGALASHTTTCRPIRDPRCLRKRIEDIDSCAASIVNA